MAAERWATFDCYGTLIDWNAGIGRELERIFGSEAVPRLLHRYHELEPHVERDEPTLTYRDVLNRTLARIAEADGLEVPPQESDALARSLPEWRPFPEVPDALRAARARGWKLAALSNTDRDFIEASLERIGVPFELAIVASELGSYKPGHAHWQVFAERAGADPARHVHVGASLFHDIAPALELQLPVVWINRLGEDPEPQPTRELHDLAALPDTLDELVAA